MAYKDISVDKDALNSLPMNGNIMDTRQTVNEPGEQEEGQTDDLEMGDKILQQNDVSIVGDVGQSEQIDLHLRDTHKENSIPQPKTGVIAINEFTTESYLVRAFLALFPRDLCALRSLRKGSVT